MSKDELPEEVKKEITSYVRGLMQKRQQEQDEYNDYVADLQSNGGKIKKSDEATLKRKQRTIERLDKRLERRGFVSGEELQVTSKTIEIGSGLEGLHPKAEFNIPPKSSGSGGGGVVDHPFRITSTQNPNNENQYFVTVGVGTLNTVLASNWTIEGSIGLTQLVYVVLTASAAANVIVSTSLSLDSSPPTAEQSPVKWGLPTSFKVLIGLVRGPQVWQVVFNNLSYAGVKRITTDRANPQIGQLPYDNFYVWQLQ
jgi:hypothetical protein